MNMVKNKQNKLYHSRIRIHNRNLMYLNKQFMILHLQIHKNQYFIHQTHNQEHPNELSYLIYFYNTLHSLLLSSINVFVFINSP